MAPRIDSQRGFSLIEVVVALLIGVFMVLSAGNLGAVFFHQRASYDSISAATSLAERVWEQLRDIQNPVGGSPPGTTTNSNFTNGSHTATNSPMKEDGTAGGPYVVSWTVSDPFPTGLVVNSQCASGMSGMKKVVINVTHQNNSAVNVQFVTYYKVC
jgi:prepilin-type N-terminal cleavage/methylation domain-containing protein